MTAKGFSSPSTVWFCSAVYTSEKLIGVGEAPSDLKRSTHSAPAGVRILKFARSSAVLIGCVLEVIWRIPLAHIFGKTTSPLASMSLRTYAPSAPSTAENAWGEFLKAKPTA